MITLDRVSVEEALKKYNGKLERVLDEIGILKALGNSVLVRFYPGKNEYYDGDYSHAQDFRIATRDKTLEHTSGYEGGYVKIQTDTYPQFFYTVKSGKRKARVYVEHEGFEKDPRVVIASVVETRGSKDYGDMNRTYRRDVDRDAVFEFFRERGVAEKLLKRLDRRIKQAGEFG